MEDFIKVLSDLKLKLIKEEELKIGFPIEEGQYESIYEGTFNNSKVAIKKLYLYSFLFEKEVSFINSIYEFNKLQTLEDDNISKFIGFCIAENDRIIYFVSEFIEGKSLKELYPFLKDNEKIDIIHKLCSILVKLHNKNLYHSNLKPSKIIINNDKVILINDEIYCKFKFRILPQICGFSTLNNYDIPEIYEIDEEFNRSIISTKADIWSLGLIISEIFSGCVPWYKFNNFQIIKRLMNKTLFTMPEISNKFALSLAKMCLIMEVDKRPTSNEICKVLEEYKLKNQ